MKIDRRKLHEFLTGMAVGYLQAAGYVVTYDPTQPNPLDDLLESLRMRVGGPAFGGPCGRPIPFLGPCELPAEHAGKCAVAARAPVCGDRGCKGCA